MGLLSTLVLASLLNQNSSIDWSAFPSFEQKITVRDRMARLPDLLTEVGQKVGVRISCAPTANDLKATVMVHDMPAREVVDRVADVLGLTVKSLGKGVEVYEDLGRKALREGYLDNENQFLWMLALKRLDALLAAVPSVEGDEPPQPSDEDLARVDESADLLHKWAQYEVRQPWGYAAAMIQSSHRPAAHALDVRPFAHRFELSHTARSAEFGIQSLDRYSLQFRGRQFMLYFDIVSGAWMSTEIGGDPFNSQIEKVRPFPRFTEPPERFSKQAYPQLVAAWPKDKLPEEYQKKRAVEETEEFKLPVYSSGGYTLSDHLTWMHYHTGMNVIADAYRMPSKRLRLFAAGDSVEGILRDLQKADNCYLKADTDCVEVRHCCFWRLRATEPPETATLRLEKAAAARQDGLDAYADFAGTVFYWYWTRVTEPGRFSATFDMEPLRRSFWPLWSIGTMPPEDRKRLWQGQVLSMRQARSLDTHFPSGTQLYFAGRLMCFGQAQIVGRYADLLEETLVEGASPFLTLEGRVAGEMVDLVKNLPALYLSLVLPNAPDGLVGIYLSASARDGAISWLTPPHGS